MLSDILPVNCWCVIWLREHSVRHQPGQDGFYTSITAATREMLTVLQTAQDEYHILCAAHSPESFNLRGKKNVSCIFYIVCNILLICCLFFWGWLFNPMILILRFSKWQHTHEKQTHAPRELHWHWGRTKCLQVSTKILPDIFRLAFSFMHLP